MTSDPNCPEVVASQLTEPEATALIKYLSERGFDVRPWGAHVAALYTTFLPGESMQIVVRRPEAVRARKAVDEFQRKQRSPDFQAAEIAGDRSPRTP